MQRIIGLPEEQVLAYEAQAEAIMRAALAAVMEKIAARIEASMPVLVGATPGLPDDGLGNDPLSREIIDALTVQGDSPEDVVQTLVDDGINEAVARSYVAEIRDFIAQRAAALPPGQPFVSPDDLASIPPLWQQAVAEQLVPVAATVFLDAAGRTYANMVEASNIAGLPSVGSLAAEQYLAQAKNTFEQVGDDLWATARAQLVEGFEQGESIPELATRLRQSAGITARRAVLVARTQVNEASNAGSFAVAQASGLRMQKEWISTPDLRTRPTHLAADGQRVPLNEPFIVGGFSAMFPAAHTLPPAERYSCRCAVGYVMPDKAPSEVRADDLQAQQLADLPGTTQGLPERFGETFPKGSVPGIDLPVHGTNPPSYVRPSLRAAKTPRQLRRAWQDEVEAVTGFPFVVDAMPRGISMVTAREYAEGTLQMFAQFPAAKVDRIHWFDDAASSSYARVRRGGHAIEFNMRYASEAGRPRFLAARRRDVAGWDDLALGTSWGVRNDLSGQGIVYHEFTHILDIENTREVVHGQIVPLLIQHAQRLNITDIDDMIKRQISSYATKNYQEMVAEAGADVMVNGAAASALSRDIFDLVRAEYRRRGFEIRTAPAEGEIFPKVAAPKSISAMTVADLRAELTARGIAIPPKARKADLVREVITPVAPRALSTQTVAQLRALAKERGIVIPVGARKADLVKALSDETSTASKAMPSLEVRTSLSAAEQTRVRALVRRDPQIVATVQDRHGPISWSGNLSDADAAWLEQTYKRDRPFVERVAQEADIRRTIAAEAKRLGITPTQYRAREAVRLKTLLDQKLVAVRVRDEAGLQDILSSGRFKTSLEGARRAQGLVVAKDRRQLGESIMGVPPDVPVAERPVYGYVAVRGIEPALSAGRKIEGLAQREGQEDILSTYGQIQVVLKPEIRVRTTVTVGDSLDEVGFVRPSPIDNPSAESIGSAMRLENAITEPNWTRTRYVEAQIHGGLRREDILEVIFPGDPSAAMVTQLREAGISWRVLRKGDAPIFPTAQVVAPLDEKALLRAAARERNRLIESSQGTARLLAEVDELIANKASKAAIRQRLDPALIAPEQVYAGADPAVVEALRKALDTGDSAKLRAALTRAGTKAKLKGVSKAGAKAKYDPETMEGVGGIDIPAGAQVTVVRRGTTLTLPDGTTMQLTRAQVTPIAPKPAPVKAAKAAKPLPEDLRDATIRPGRDILAQVSRDRQEWLDDAVRAADDLTEVGNPILTAAVRQQAGWSDPAPVLTARELDSAVSAGWTEMWRGVSTWSEERGLTAARIARETPRGDWIQGDGIYGNGFYTSVRRTTAEGYRQSNYGYGYGNEGWGPAPLFEWQHGFDVVEPGGILRMALNPAARIIDYEDLLVEYRAWLQTPGASVLGSSSRDSSFYAVLRGYDGVRIRGVRGVNDGSEYPDGVTNDHEADQYIIFNRSVLAFERPGRRFDNDRYVRGLQRG